jgi:hypothetical protein
MSEDPVTDVLPSKGDGPADKVSQTPADRLRLRYQQLQSDQVKDFDIPGYGGELVGRYKPLDEKDLKDSLRKLARIGEEDRQIIAALDLLIDSNVEMFFRGDDGKLVSLSEDGSPVSYDQELAAVLGFEADKRRVVVKKVFTVGEEFNVPSLISHAQDVGAWMTDVSQEVGSTLEGE